MSHFDYQFKCKLLRQCECWSWSKQSKIQEIKNRKHIWSQYIKLFIYYIIIIIIIFISAKFKIFLIKNEEYMSNYQNSCF